MTNGIQRRVIGLKLLVAGGAAIAPGCVLDISGYHEGVSDGGPGAGGSAGMAGSGTGGQVGVRSR